MKAGQAAEAAACGLQEGLGWRAACSPLAPGIGSLCGEREKFFGDSKPHIPYEEKLPCPELCNLFTCLF